MRGSCQPFAQDGVPPTALMSFIKYSVIRVRSSVNIRMPTAINNNPLVTLIAWKCLLIQEETLRNLSTAMAASRKGMPSPAE